MALPDLTGQNIQDTYQRVLIKPCSQCRCKPFSAREDHPLHAPNAESERQDMLETHLQP